MRLIDADKLEPDTEWNDYDDDFVSYSQSQIRNAEEVQAIPLDKVKKAREEILRYRADCELSDDEYPACKDCTRNVFDTILRIIDKLIGSEDS